jgi:hypothetical protein
MTAVKEPPRVRAAWLAVFAAAFITQAFSNGYFLYYLAMASALVVIGELASQSMSGADRLRTAGWLAVAAACILACVGIVAAAYLSVRRQYGFVRPYGDWAIFSANLRSYVSPRCPRASGGSVAATASRAPAVSRPGDSGRVRAALQPAANAAGHDSTRCWRRLPWCCLWLSGRLVPSPSCRGDLICGLRG